MSAPILTVNIRYENDIVVVRQRARQIAQLAGFDAQDQTRIATAVSEIARNAFRYAGGGKAEYFVEGDGVPETLLIRIIDTGPGIGDLDRILDGRYRSQTGMGLGILGARRLVDDLVIESGGTGTTVVMRKHFSRKQGTTLELVARMSASLAAQKPQDAYGELQFQNQELMRALDELRKRQEELSRLNRELEDTNRGVVALYAELDEKADHLRRADDLKSKFLSNMSHEFRSPLNSILALTRLLVDELDGPLNDEQKQQVGYVRRAAEDLYELVNDLLDLAKVEAGKVEVKPVEFDVVNLFGALRGMLRPLFLNQSVNLVFEDAANLPPIVCDEGKVSQILRNFISNALKFTERGEVRVSAELLEGGRMMFSVADTGIGIAKEDQERIFQDFAQVDNPIQKRVKGTGLGLPLSRKLAQLLGGEVKVSSQVGLGSVFSVVIPTAPPKMTEQHRADRFLVRPGARPILVVENSDNAVHLYERHLNDSAFQVLRASSLLEARTAMSVFEPAAIVLDILLDGEESWDFLSSLKQNAATRRIPVLVVTTVEDRRKGYHLGADGFLNKPVDPEAFRNELNRITTKPPGDRVLIIDDNERDRYLLRHCLRDSSIIVSEATNGTEGLEKARSESPQLIFLDLAMPEMSGFEVFDRLRSESLTSHIPVIISTSMRVGETDRERLKGAVGLLSKQHFGQANMSKTVQEMMESALHKT